jgi:hypothetical protein
MVAPKLRSFGTGQYLPLLIRGHSWPRPDVLTPAGEVRTGQGTFPNAGPSDNRFASGNSQRLQVDAALAYAIKSATTAASADEAMPSTIAAGTLRLKRRR